MGPGIAGRQGIRGGSQAADLVQHGEHAPQQRSAGPGSLHLVVYHPLDKLIFRLDREAAKLLAY